TLPLLNTSESKTFANWRIIPYKITNAVYLYNVTNPAEVEKGQTPIFQELGPYVFREKRVKENVKWLAAINGSDSYETIEYEQVKLWHFVPEESNGTLNDAIRHLNVPVVTAAKTVKDEGGGWLKYLELNGAILTTGSELFPKHTADELLFVGYIDKFIKLLETFHVKLPFHKFGWFHGKNESADGIYRIYSGTSQATNAGKMYAWNRHRHLNMWSGDVCNSLNDVFHGDLFPPFEDPNPKLIKLWAADLCRYLRLDFNGTQNLYGVEANRYTVTQSAFNYTMDENKCFCSKDGCPADGLTDASPCMFGAPIGASLPHFLYADSAYSSRIEGIEKGDPNHHSFFMDIEPTLGIPVRFALRMQVNVLLENNKNMKYAKYLKESIYYPQMWFSVTAEMDEQMSKQLYLVQHLQMYINIVASVILSISVIILIVWIALEVRNHVKKTEETVSYDTLVDENQLNINVDT
ncbi:Protein croquemort-like protein, partial [Leptotrombidium deliense]